jgi:DNA-binding transcriptional ArsR family regulator
VDTLSAIAEPNRRKIVQLLARRGNLSASEIAGHFESSAPAISQHLQVLREAKTVSVTRQAQKRIYSLNPEPLQELSAWLFDLTNQWEQRLNKLETLLRKEKNKSPDPHKSQSKKGKDDAKDS